MFFIQFAVPDLLDFFDLRLAEALPRGHLTALFGHLTLIPRRVAGSIINGLLRDVAQLKRNLNDLTHVWSRSAPA
jgi:hypothetical protein